MVQLWAPQKVSGSRLRSFYSRCRRNAWGDRLRGWLWPIKICFPNGWVHTKSRFYVCPIFWNHTRVIVWTCWSENSCFGKIVSTGEDCSAVGQLETTNHCVFEMSELQTPNTRDVCLISIGTLYSRLTFYSEQLQFSRFSRCYVQVLISICTLTWQCRSIVVHNTVLSALAEADPRHRLGQDTRKIQILKITIMASPMDKKLRIYYWIYS